MRAVEGTERVGRLGMVARWKPVHLGHAAVLRALVRCADQVFVGIGSSNRYDADNPFTPRETAEMIRLVLRGHARYALLEVPDLGNGPRWREMVTSLFGPLDMFVTANTYVRDLLREDYPVVHPLQLVPAEERFPVEGRMVRLAMARGDAWEEVVPPEVGCYLVDRHLVERFRLEFGSETLERESSVRASPEGLPRHEATGDPESTASDSMQGEAGA